ncbi:MAG TPA: FecR domain-containing protein [Nannocystaceae bacterium]|nr:FecR domain-containing protein [Nannocystaceae bacterium]
MREDLRALAGALDRVEPPSSLRHRVLAGRRDDARASGPRFAIVMLALAAGVLIGWVLFARPAPTPAEATMPEVAARPEATPVRTDCPRTLGTEAVAVARGCRIELADLGVIVDVWDASQLARDGRVLALPEGSASFEVAAVGAAPAIEVDVGAGRVRVLGTRFEIQNRGDTGHLDLIHGRVEFVAKDGDVRMVSPGERMSWARTQLPAAIEVPAPTPIDKPRVTPSKPSTPVELDLDDALEQVARMRHAGDFTGAEALLRRTLRGVEDGRAREVLSFEIGTIIEAAGETDRACAHWREHERFGERAHQRAATHRERLACPTD